MNSMEDSLKKRYSTKLLASIVSGIIGAILIAIVPKALGPIAYGNFVYLQDFFMKVIGFLDMGSSIAFFTKLSARDTRRELITFYLLYSLFVLAAIFIFIFIIDSFSLVHNIFPNIPNQYIYMGLLFGFFTWFTQIFIKISDAYALTISVELIKIIHKIFSLFLLIYLVYFTTFNLDSYFSFHYISLASFLAILFYLFIKKDIFNKKLLNINFGFKNLSKEFLEYCSPLVVYSLLAVVAGLFDLWLLQKVAGSIQTGFYGLAYSLAAMCFIFTSAMTPIITREFAKSYEQKDLQRMKILYFRYIPMLYSLAAYFAIFISIQSENILIMFTDEKFKDAYLVLVVMAFYPIHQTYGQLSGSIFYATGQTKLIRNMAFVTMPIGMILSFSFIYLLEYEAVGLATKMILGQIIGVNIQLYLNSKFLNFKMKSFVFHQFYSVVFFSVLAYFSSSLIQLDTPFRSFLVSGILYTILVIISTYIFPQVFSIKRTEMKEIFLRLVNVIKK